MINWPVEILDNKYKKWYERIIAQAIPRTLPKNIYTEKHHIIPRCFGGSDAKTNLVKLTAREHYIVHALLWKMSMPKRQHIQMMTAFGMMNNMFYDKRDYRINSRLFESLRIENSNYRKTLTGNKNPRYGVPMSEKVKANLKEVNYKKYLERLSMRFVGPIKPTRAIEFRGHVYHSRGEASRATGIPGWTITTQIKHWGNSPDAETINKIDSGELIYPKEAPNKGIPMSKEQRLAIKETKRIKFQKLKEAGLPNPNTGRKATEETRRKISEKATGRKATEETRRIMSQASKGKPKSLKHIEAICLAKAAKKLALSANPQ